MNYARRRFVAALPALTLGSLPSLTTAQSQVDTARLLCGYPPGGSIDVVCRALGPRLAGRYARTVIVENKPGAGGRMAVVEAKRSLPDGSTFLVTPASTLTMYPHVYKNLDYSPFTDLEPLSMLASFGFAFAVGPRVPASVSSFSEFASWCKANPSMAECGNAGAGSFPHFMAMLLAHESGLTLTHIPFKGSSAALQDVAGGHVSAVMSTEGSAFPLSQSGRIRILATSWPDRSPFNPGAPTFREIGLPKLTQREWFGAFAPRGTSVATLQTATAALAAAARSSEVREELSRHAMIAEGTTSSELKTPLREEHDFWGPIIRASGFTPET